MSIEAHRTPRWRVALFVALVAAGVGYIVAFVLLTRHSVDFVAHARTKAAISAASARGTEAVSELLFKQGSADLSLLATGWRRPGSEGTWAEGEGGTLYLPTGFAAGARTEVRFDGQLNLPDRVMQVSLDVDGLQIGRWQLSHANWHITDRVAIPAQAPGAAPRQLRFRIDRPRRALWLGYDPGLLAYGIHLYHLRVESSPSTK